MPATAFQHFQEDVERAKALVTHADSLPTPTVAAALMRSDILRSAWMFAVGALDAYFCDAYTDVVAATIISKNRHAAAIVPEFFYDIKFPVRAILEPYPNNVNWKWRMAARKMMERENVLSFESIKGLFNKFFRADQRFFRDALLDAWISHPLAKRRVFGITTASFTALDPAELPRARNDARQQMNDRFETIFQRRHDCIHNCDRPRVSPQPLVKGGTVLKVIEDVEFLVARCNDHIDLELREFMLGCGFPAAVIAQAGY